MIRLIRITLQLWFDRPLWAASLLVLIGVMVLGGPSACLAHCMLLDAAHHHQRLLPASHEHGAHHDASGHPSCPGSTQHSEHAEPSALTVAILPLLPLLPLLLAASVRHLGPTLRGLSIVLRPLPRPPRLAHS